MKIGPQAMWTTSADGTRTRIYCKICLMEGQSWLTPEPCSHILQDRGQKVEPQTIRDNLKGLAL